MTERAAQDCGSVCVKTTTILIFRREITEATMLTNTLLLYMTQEAIAKARAKLNARKGETASKDEGHATSGQSVWQARRHSAKQRLPLRH